MPGEGLEEVEPTAREAYTSSPRSRTWTARRALQTVTRDAHAEFYDLLEAFDARTGCPVLINTSFNVRGEPIVCTPDDAYLCFMRTNMDVLVLGNQILLKEEQPQLVEDFDWRERYALD